MPLHENKHFREITLKKHLYYIKIDINKIDISWIFQYYVHFLKRKLLFITDIMKYFRSIMSVLRIVRKVSSVAQEQISIRRSWLVTFGTTSTVKTVQSSTQ